MWSALRVAAWFGLCESENLKVKILERWKLEVVGSEICGSESCERSGCDCGKGEKLRLKWKCACYNKESNLLKEYLSILSENFWDALTIVLNPPSKAGVPVSSTFLPCPTDPHHLPVTPLDSKWTLSKKSFVGKCCWTKNNLNQINSIKNLRSVGRMSFLAGPLEGKEQMVRFHLHRKSLLMHLASCYIWCCVNCIFVGCELLCRGASRRIFPVGISQPLSRSLEFWNIWNIEIFGILDYLEHWNIATTIKVSGILEYLEYWNIWNIGILEYWNIWNIETFGILEYLEHWNIATTIKVFLLLLRERTSEESEHREFSNEESKYFCIFKQLKRLSPRDTWSKISRFGGSNFFTETFLDTERSHHLPWKTTPHTPAPLPAPPHTLSSICSTKYPALATCAHLQFYNSTILHVYMSTCLHVFTNPPPPPPHTIKHLAKTATHLSYGLSCDTDQ